MLPIYKGLFRKELSRFQPQEIKATCDHCWMSRRRSDAQTHYQSHLKCCTFEPFMPNYLVGALLVDTQVPSETKLLLKQRIKDSRFVLPIGMIAPLRYQVQFNQRKPDDFGNRADWLCSFYDQENQNCRIWKYRSSVCDTFYCTSNYGPKGMTYWKKMNDYLTYVEMALLEEVLVYLDFSPRQISDNLAYLNRYEASKKELSWKSLPESVAKPLWNGYFDEQVQFYEKCYKMVMSFDRKRFEECLGEMGLELENKVIQQLEKIR